MKIWLPITAATCLLLGIIMVIASHLVPSKPAIPFPPPIPPYDHFVAAVGVIEASSEDIYIGTPLSEVVSKVHVVAGEFVPEGTPLFSLNTDFLSTRLAEAQAALAVSNANYTKQLDLPRPETVPIKEAILEKAQANYLDFLSQFEIAEKLKDPRAISRDEFNQRKYRALGAKYEVEEAQADLDLLLAGAWIRDLTIYREKKKQAEKNVEIIAREIERSTICAPMSGVVLRVNVRPGEFAQASELDTPLMIFGVLEPLHVRVDVDEEDVWRLIQGAPGMAYVRGNSGISTELKYVRIEPYLIPKRALSGDTAEKVDTRVLQVIYRFKRGELPIYPGEMVDIYLEAKPSEVQE